MKKLLLAVVTCIAVTTMVIPSATTFAAPKAKKAVVVNQVQDEIKYYDENGNQVFGNDMYYDKNGNPMFGQNCYYNDADGNPVYVGGCRIYYYDDSKELYAGNCYYDANGKIVRSMTGNRGGCCGNKNR